MKLKQIFKEASDNIAAMKFFKDNFDFEEGTLTFGEYGVVVNGDLRINDKASSSITELPIKIHSVSGIFSMSATYISDLKNFPSEAGSIEVVACPNLKSLATDGTIICEIEFTATDCPSLINLDNVKIQTDILDVSGSKNLKTILGNSLKVKRFFATKCKSLSQDPMLIPGIEEIDISLNLPNLPLVRMILNTQEIPKILFRDNKDPKLQAIVKKYNKKGSSACIQLIKELMDNGYAGNAEL